MPPKKRDSNPRLLAAGQMVAGLAISVLAALGIGEVDNPDLLAFIGIALSSGLTLAGWAFLANYLSESAPGRHTRIAGGVVVVSLLAVAMQVNARADFFLFKFVDLEIALAVCSVLAAFGAALIFLLRHYKKGSKSARKVRIQSLAVFSGVFLTAWLTVSQPFKVWHHIYEMSFVDRNENHRVALLTMPDFLVRPAVKSILSNSGTEHHLAALELAARKSYVDSEILAALCRNPRYLYQPIAFRTLIRIDPARALTLATELYRDDSTCYLVPFEWLLGQIKSCGGESFAALLDTKFSERAVVEACLAKRHDLMRYAVDRFSIESVVTFVEQWGFDYRYGFSYDIRDELALALLEDEDVKKRIRFGFWNVDMIRLIDTRTIRPYLLSAERILGYLAASQIRVFEKAFSDQSFEVLQIAYQKFYACAANADALRATLEPKDGDREFKIRSACATLLREIKNSAHWR